MTYFVVTHVALHNESQMCDVIPQLLRLLGAHKRSTQLPVEARSAMWREMKETIASTNLELHEDVLHVILARGDLALITFMAQSSAPPGACG